MPSAPPPQKATYSAETKAAALSALLAGQSVSAIAREYHIPKGTVSAWKQRNAPAMQPSASGDADGATQKASAIGDLLLQLVEQNIRGLIAASAVLQDMTWVKEQGAAELGTFFGITHDKVIRMLEAMDRSGAPPT